MTPGRSHPDCVHHLSLSRTPVALHVDPGASLMPRVFVVVQSRPMKRSCPSKGACFSKAHSNVHETSCVSKFCLGRRTKQPEVDKPLSVAHVAKLLSPYGKFQRSTNSEMLWRQQDQIPPSRIDHVTSPSSQSLSSALATRSGTLRNV